MQNIICIKVNIVPVMLANNGFYNNVETAKSLL